MSKYSHGEQQRKLPRYEKLKELYLSGMTLSEIAAKYGVTNKQAVHKVLKARALARDEWPLPRPRRSPAHKVRAWNEKNHTVVKNGHVLWSLVEDYMRDNGLCMIDFADQAGLSYIYVQQKHAAFVRRRTMTIQRSYAARLLETIGEPIPWSLWSKKSGGVQIEQATEKRLARSGL